MNSKRERHKRNKAKGEIDLFSNKVSFTAGIGTLLVLLKDTINIWVENIVILDFVVWFLLLVCLGLFCASKKFDSFLGQEAISKIGAFLTVISILLMLMESLVLKYTTDFIDRVLFTILFVALLFLSGWAGFAICKNNKKTD